MVMTVSILKMCMVVFVSMIVTMAIESVPIIIKRMTMSVNVSLISWFMMVMVVMMIMMVMVVMMVMMVIIHIRGRWRGMWLWNRCWVVETLNRWFRFIRIVMVFTRRNCWFMITMMIITYLVIARRRMVMMSFRLWLWSWWIVMMLNR